MVRRSAATNLGKFAATIEPAHLKTDIMSIFEELTQDGKHRLGVLKFYLSNAVNFAKASIYGQ